MQSLIDNGGNNQTILHICMRSDFHFIAHIRYGLLKNILSSKIAFENQIRFRITSVIYVNLSEYIDIVKSFQRNRIKIILINVKVVVTSEVYLYLSELHSLQNRGSFILLYNASYV